MAQNGKATALKTIHSFNDFLEDLDICGFTIAGKMSYARKMVPPVGIEPTTRGFSVPCSTN